MKFLPFETTTLETKLTEEEILNRLANYIEPNDYFGFRLVSTYERERPYEGKTKNREFKIKRITYFRRDTPVICGNLEERFDWRVIHLTIRPRIDHLVASCLAYLFFGFQFFINFLAEPFGFISNLFLGMIILGYFITIYRFNAESTKAKIDLQKLLEAREK